MQICFFVFDDISGSNKFQHFNTIDVTCSDLFHLPVFLNIDIPPPSCYTFFEKAAPRQHSEREEKQCTN